MGRWLGGWMFHRLNGRMDGWMDGWMDRHPSLEPLELCGNAIQRSL